LTLLTVALETSGVDVAFSWRAFKSESALAEVLDAPGQQSGEGVQHFSEDFISLQQSGDDCTVDVFASPDAIAAGALNIINIQTIANIA
jgi:hypothetical protein